MATTRPARKLSTTLATFALDAITDRAAKYEAAVSDALKRLAAGDLSAERDADLAMEKLDAVLEEMGAIEAAMVGPSRTRVEIVQFLAA